MYHLAPDPVAVIQQPPCGAHSLAEAAAYVVNTLLQLSGGFGAGLGVSRNVEVIGVVAVSFGSLGHRIQSIGRANSTIGAGSRNGNAHDSDVVAGELVERAWLEAGAVRLLATRALQGQAGNHLVLIVLFEDLGLVDGPKGEYRREEAERDGERE